MSILQGYARTYRQFLPIGEESGFDSGIHHILSVSHIVFLLFNIVHLPFWLPPLALHTEVP